MRPFRKIHLCTGPKGPGQPGFLSRVWGECYDGDGFPTAFGVRAELGNSRPSEELQMADSAFLVSWPEAFSAGRLLQDGILGKLSHHRASRAPCISSQWLISITIHSLCQLFLCAAASGP